MDMLSVMHSLGHSMTLSDSPELQLSSGCNASTGLRSRHRALSSNPSETSWLLSELVSDPIDNARSAPIGVAVDCVRARLSKADINRERERMNTDRMTEYNRLIKDRFAQAALIKELGVERAKARMLELQLYGASVNDKSNSVMYRFERMIDRVFEYFQVKGMRMEPFQIELFRGVVLGVTSSQFGDSLFKYKHPLLEKLCLAPLGSENYDHVNPALGHLYQVEREFSRYANPYTLCLAPRQCGKSLMMRLLLAAVLLHLDINIMVQAQNKHMCNTLRVGVESAMEELQHLQSFQHTEKPVTVCGNPENRIYRFDPGYKGSSFAHFLASSNDASRGQSADLILVDEVGFVNSKVLLAVLPNIAFRGRKQVHITSHVNNTPWLNKVADIRGDDGEPAYHVVSQSFKCRFHEREPGPTCFCLGVYCPQHISVDNHLKELMNMVTPKGFESEVTGSSSTSSTDTKTDNTTPFEPSVINKFLSNNSVTLEYMSRASVVRAYLCLDPTFGGGSKSCAGVCCAVELTSGKLVVMALEELEIRDLDQVTRVYAALLSAHIRLLKVVMPRVMWKEVPVIVVFEQNTYVNALVDVKHLIENTLVRSGFKVLFYSKWSHINNKYMLGKHVGAKTKLAMVLSTVFAINRETLYYCDTVMSLGWAVLSEATKNTRTIESSMGTSKGAGSSNKMGSNMDVFMYRRSRKGVNVATDIMAGVLETRDIIALPRDRLTDKAHAEQGKMLLGKLREEMAMVTIAESAKGSIVTTGGKKSVQGEYTRDDMLSAFLLLCHTRDEIYSGETSISLGGEVYYK